MPTVAASSSNQGATRTWSSASSMACGHVFGSPTGSGRRRAGARSTKPALPNLLRDAQYALDSGDTVLAGQVIALLCRAIRVWRHRERLTRRCGPGVIEAFFWRHFLALSEMIAQPIAGNVAAEKFRRSLLRW